MMIEFVSTGDSEGCLPGSYSPLSRPPLTGLDPQVRVSKGGLFFQMARGMGSELKHPRTPPAYIDDSITAKYIVAIQEVGEAPSDSACDSLREIVAILIQRVADSWQPCIQAMIKDVFDRASNISQPLGIVQNILG